MKLKMKPSDPVRKARNKVRRVANFENFQLERSFVISETMTATKIIGSQRKKMFTSLNPVIFEVKATIQSTPR